MMTPRCPRFFVVSSTPDEALEENEWLYDWNFAYSTSISDKKISTKLYDRNSRVANILHKQVYLVPLDQEYPVCHSISPNNQKYPYYSHHSSLIIEAGLIVYMADFVYLIAYPDDPILRYAESKNRKLIWYNPVTSQWKMKTQKSSWTVTVRPTIKTVAQDPSVNIVGILAPWGLGHPDEHLWNALTNQIFTFC